VSSASASEKSSLEGELREMKLKAQAVEASKRQLEQQNKLINDELIVCRQQQVTASVSMFSLLTAFMFFLSASQGWFA